ncbi:cytidine deaminase-like protein [Scheffersomyces coipomensis]|uniref:cytidine deaminase-like protein n=1 Tax=Scheffersomyces coipomensis TaxID=1788519 RepID=UPI00315D5DB1
MVTIHTDHKELTTEEFNTLKSKCLAAKDLSYSPYSNFRVGCTLITESGTYISGANIENASYGACICAERTTISKALLEGHKKLKVIAISSDDKDPISPCGICRQFIREFGVDIPIYMFGNSGQFIKVYLEDLLPLSFGPENLGKPSIG